MPRDETQPVSPKRSADLLENPFGGDRGNLSGPELSQTPLGFGKPEPLCIGIYFLIEAGDEALRETSALPARKLQGFRFELASWFSHTERVSRRPRPTPESSTAHTAGLCGACRTTKLSSGGGAMVPESLHAPAVCCSAWFGVPRYQNRPHGFLVAAGSRAPELPGLPPADARCDRSRRAI